MKKIFFAIAVVFLLVFSICCGFLFTEVGRNFLIAKATKYFFQDSVQLVVNGMDPAVRNIDYVSIKTDSGITVKLENIRIDREGFFGIPYFRVRNVELVYVQKTSENGVVKSSGQKKKIISIAKMIPLFTTGFEISKLSLILNKEKYELDGIKYSSKDQKVSLHSEKYGYLSAQLNFGLIKHSSIRVMFSECYDFEGDLFVDDVFSSRAKVFHIAARHKFCDIDASGNFFDLGEKISIDQCRLTRGNDRISLSGAIYPKTKKIAAEIPMKFQNIPTATRAIPEKIANVIIDYFDGSVLRIDSNLFGNFATKAFIKKGEDTIVSANLNYQNGVANIHADSSAVNVYGYGLTHIDSTISEKKIVANLIGNDFRVETSLERKGEIFKLSKFDIFSKFGNAMLKLPIVLPMDFSKKNCFKVGFDIQDLSFFNKFVPSLKGKGKGEIEYNGTLDKIAIQDAKFKLYFPKIEYDKISGSKVTAESDGKSYKIAASMLKLPQAILRELAGSVRKDNFDVKCIVNEKNNVAVSGRISDDFQKIILQKGTLKFGKRTLTLQNSSLNFADNTYVLNGKFPKHKRPSYFQVNLNSGKCIVDFSDIHLADFSEMIGKKLHGTLNGNLALNNVGGIFQGNGKATLSNVLTCHNTTDISFDFQRDKVILNTSLNRRGNIVRCDITLPFAIRNGLQVADTVAKFGAHLYGKNKLENFIELPDKSELRGDFDCDCLISGTFKKPIISGYVNVKNTLIRVNSVLLANGNLQFAGEGSNLRVISAKFIDNKKNTVTGTGYGRLFFDNFSPNLDVNLDFDFKKFFILSSDSLAVQVTGKGKMSGPLNDMKLTGDLQVPYAKISNFESQDDLENSKLEFENDPLLSAQQKKQSTGNSFFTYDILLHCQRVKVAGKLFQLFLKGDLNLSMFGKQDTLVGNLKLIDGRLDLFGKRMKFVEGDVSFLQKYPYNPKARFVCRKNFGNMLVTLEVTNSAKKGASIKISSNPNYSLDVILAQMLFGKDTKSLSAGEAAQLVQAVSSLNDNQGVLLSMLSRMTNTGLWDSISFSSDDGKYSSSLNKNSQTATQQINISAGKYLRDNVYVSLNKKDDQTTFDIDVSLTPTVSVKANTAGEVGLSWKYRY